MSSNRPQLLAIVERLVGHVNYGNILGRYASQESGRLDVRVHWHDEGVDGWTYGLRRLLGWPPFPSWAQARNLDWGRLRFHLGVAFPARRLISQALSTGECQGIYLKTQTMGLLSQDLMARIPSAVSIDATVLQTVRALTPASFHWTHRPNLCLERRAYAASRLVVATSRWAADSLIRDYGLAASKVEVVPYALEPDRFPVKDWSVSTNKPFQLLFIGNDVQRKGLPALVRAVSDFLPGAILHVVSHDPVESHPQIRIHRGVRTCTPEWYALMAEADCFVLPSRYEPFAWVTLEAMACGLPVVATRVGGLAEIVDDGVTGLLVEPDNVEQLAKVLQHMQHQPQLRRSMGLAGRQRIEDHFDASRVLSHLEDVLCRALRMG